MAFCTNCGAQLEEGASFCTNCGTKVEQASVQPSQNPQPVPQQAPVTGQPGLTFKPKKKSKGGTVVAVVLILLAIAAVVGAVLMGGKDSDNPNLGVYNSVSLKVAGFDMGDDDAWIELKSGGSAKIFMLDDTYSGKWALEGNKITITQRNDEFQGTLENGVLKVDFAGMEYTFVKEGAEVNVEAAATLPAAQSTDPEPAATAEAGAETTEAVDLDWWEGDWYGWWAIINASGKWTELEDDYWDCCARIELNDEGVGEIMFWDEDCEADEYSASGEIMIMAGNSDRGAMITTSGEFYDSDLSYAWYADPANEVMTGIENAICFIATYTDPENSEDSFDYFVLLRPWGEKWEDVKDMDTTDEIYDDMMPGMYEWYCAQIDSGVKTAPDVIGD